jgi:hypothetical protein
MKLHQNKPINNDKSQASELFAASLLFSEFNKAFAHVYMINGAIFKPNDGFMPSTAEADTIVICEGGIYVFEVKSWDGQVSQDGVTFLVSNADGKPKNRDNPIHQNTRKCKYIKTLVPGVNVQNRVLITGENASLDYKLPPLVMTRHDIPHAVRGDAYFARHKLNLLPGEEVQRIHELLLAAVKEADVTKDEHIANCRFHHEGELACAAA